MDCNRIKQATRLQLQMQEGRVHYARIRSRLDHPYCQQRAETAQIIRVHLPVLQKKEARWSATAFGSVKREEGQSHPEALRAVLGMLWVYQGNKAQWRQQRLRKTTCYGALQQRGDWTSQRKCRPPIHVLWSGVNPGQVTEVLHKWMVAANYVDFNGKCCNWSHC